MGTAQYIAVTGAIGAGATTLAAFIERNWDSETLLEGKIESVNPFFEDAQRDPVRWSFTSQTHFLAASVRRHDVLRRLLASTDKEFVIEDRTPFEHTGVYARSAHSLGYVKDRELDVLNELSRVVEQQYLAPSVLVYREMTVGQLTERVTERARPGESAEFVRLKSVHDAFETFISEWKHSAVVRIGAATDLHTPDGQDQAIGALAPHIGSPRRRGASNNQHGQ